MKQFITGESLSGKDGAFAPLLQNFIQEVLEAEMGAHLTVEERKKDNKRNGRGIKRIKTSAGDFEIYPLENRYSTYECETVRKRETILADTLQEKIIVLYGLGMSSRDISNNLNVWH